MAEKKSDQKVFKLSAVPTQLRYAHEIARDKKEVIQDLFEHTEHPELQRSETKNKIWTINSEKISDDGHPLIKLEFLNEISLKELLEKTLIKGGTEGFYGVMLLYQYCWNQKKLGDTIPVLEPQHLMNSVLGRKSYKLNPEDKDRICRICCKMAGIEILQYNKKETLKRRKEKKLSADEVVYDRSTLLSYNKIVENTKTKRYLQLENVKFMEGIFSEALTAKDYKKISRVFVPSETILQLSSDKRKKGKAVFLELVCLDLSYIAQYDRDEKDYDFETCIKYGQWTTNPRRKSEIWTRIINILNEAFESSLLTYTVFYDTTKKGKLIHRNIDHIRIKRLFSVDPQYLSFNFVPEQLELPMPESDPIPTGIQSVF